MRTPSLFITGIFICVLFSQCRKDPAVVPDNSEFVKYYGTSGDEIARTVQVVGDSDIAVVGYGDNPNLPGFQNPFILLTDKDGNQRWMKYLDGAANAACWSFDVRPDWGFVVAYQSAVVSGNNDFVIEKMNSDGNLTWRKSYGTPFEDMPTKILCTHDGYLVCGISNSGHDNNAWVIRLNSDGDSLWSNIYGGNGDDGAMNMCDNPDGTYAVVGYTGTSLMGSTDGFLWLLNDSGQTLHSYVFGTQGYDEPHAIVPSIDGNGWVIAGHEGVDGPDFPSHNVFLAQIGNDGVQIWNKMYGGADHDGGEDMCVHDGNYAVIGRSASHTGFDQDLFFVLVAPDGTLKKEFWFGTTADDAGYGICSNHNEILMTGYSAGGPFGGKDIYLQRKKF
ncbi:MAG TPA: hypothetical protein VL651_04650 [Bacteroidia bacterium]|jgi:hypothetical protein|nr:hypothetical protein [Bacteroidia bacterium]